MGRFDGILICSDIDGTFSLGTHVPQRNLDAVKYFQSEGGLFTLFTGRQAGYEAEFPFWINCFMVTENGTRIYDPETGRTLWTFPLDGCGAMLEWLDACPSLQGKKACSLCFTDTILEVPAGSVVDTVLGHSTGDLLKVVCRGFEDGDEAVAFQSLAQKTFQNRYDINRSWATGVEFISPLGGKGNCLKHLKTIFGDKVHTAIAIGDYENDLSMILSADRSFAPANACKEVLEAADTVLCDHKDGSIGALIEQLDREYEGGILK